VDDLLADEHLVKSGFFIPEDHPSEGSLYAMRTPTSWSRTGPSQKTSAPLLGQHTREVLQNLNFSNQEIDDLIALRVVSSAGQ